MQHNHENQCLECYCHISYKIADYSINKYSIPLCIEHQQWLEMVEQVSTKYALRLYFALKMRNIPAQIEKFDGYKHIDIAIPQARLNIEVDGVHHNYDNIQAMRDLKRTCHSLFKGYYTIRIPNSLVFRDRDLEETANYLAGLIYELIERRSFY